MSNNQNRPGYVPVTIELPAELAESFSEGITTGRQS